MPQKPGTRRVKIVQILAFRIKLQEKTRAKGVGMPAKSASVSRLNIESLEHRHLLAAVGFAYQLVEGDLGGSSSMLTSVLDGDGDLDFVSGNIRWRPNIDGRGTFGPSRKVADQSSVSHLFAGDLDSDGDNDIVSSSSVRQEGELVWYENDGQGSFGPKQAIAEIVWRSISLDGADVDGDGDLDLIHSLATGLDTGQLVWHENDGTGSFDTHVVDQGRQIGVVIDLDQDGDTDFATRDYWYENTDGHGNFVKDALHSPGPRRQLEAMADVDQNGRLDMIANGIWYQATADDPTKFFIQQQFNRGDHVDTYLGDIDGDGDLDAMEIRDVSVGLYDLHWYELTSERQFTYRGPVGPNVGFNWQVVMSDLNGDQRADPLYFSQLSGSENRTKRPGYDPQRQLQFHL